MRDATDQSSGTIFYRCNLSICTSGIPNSKHLISTSKARILIIVVIIGSKQVFKYSAPTFCRFYPKVKEEKLNKPFFMCNSEQ